MDDYTGQQFGHYRLIRQLGTGGFGSVYLGEHIYLKTQVAIKTLHVQMNHGEKQEFLREGQIVAALEHPNIVRILDFGIESQFSTFFLVMEYAPNGTLRTRHPRGSILPIATVTSYVRQIANALQYAHNQKIIHRDVKPENMLIRADGSILLSDFGIATPAHSTATQISQEIIGTMRYMAPEQLGGRPRPASDQYALGVVVYEWLSGKVPFDGDRWLEIGTQHMSAPPPPLRSKAPNISEVVEAVVMRALAKNPKDRFLTIQAFAQALEQASDSTMPSSFSGTSSRENQGTHSSTPILSALIPLEQTEVFNNPHYDFFISYNKADRERATWVADCLQQAGYSVFPLQDSYMRSTFTNEKKKAFLQAKRMIVILSPTYIYTLKSQKSSFNDFKRATLDQQDALFSIYLNGSKSMRKAFSEITNSIDLTGQRNIRAKALLLAYISGNNKALPASGEFPNRRGRLPATNISTTQREPKDQNNLRSSPQNSTLASEQTSASPIQPNISLQENPETLGSIKLPPEQTFASIDPSSPNIPQDDFYISYNKADRDKAIWIANYLKQAGYSVHFPPKDFRMKFIFINEMNKAFKHAKRMIVVLSPTYIKALKSRRGGFNNFKRATLHKQDALLSICIDNSTSIRKELSEIANHIDLSEESAIMTEALLLAYISGSSMKLPSTGISQNNLNHLSVSSALTARLEQENQTNPVLPSTKKHVVLLVHGIRTHGDWQEMAQKNLEKQDAIQVIPLRYGYFDALRFWFPFLTRKKVIERVHRDIRATLDNHRDSHLSIIAHSFGTYTIAKILEDNPDIRIYRLVLCGSVLNTDFRWDKLKNQIEGYQTGTNGVINECGTRDIWPILAQISTWGYGSAGSFGFGRPIVTDRYHDYDHGDYFSPQFVRKYWVPFIEQGVINRSNWGPEIPWWMSILSLFPLRYVIVLIIMLPIILAGLRIFHH